ncbi:MAG: GGDEF domain-containing protein [Pigmentiphaga sp.]|nr:GGDEF domain-containing protein [Pigmentiphaga sp.]
MRHVGLLELSHPVVMLCLAGLLYLTFRESGRRMQSLRQAAFAYLAYGVAITIQVAGLRDPHGLIIVVTGGLFLAAAYWIAQALCQLAGVRKADPSLAAIAILGFAARTYFTWWQPDNPIRVMALQATISILCIVAAYRARGLLRRTWVERLLLGSFAAFALFGIWRVVAVPEAALATYGFNDGRFWSSTLAMINVFAVLFAIGFIGSAFWQRLSAERRLSRTDSLTGMLNRRGFAEAARDSVRGVRGYALVLFDLDRFKDLNDTWGHGMGDAVLAEVGRIVADGTRLDDVVARFGGEEFVILLPETTLAEAGKIAERLRADIEAHTFGKAQQAVRCTASFGVAVFEAATPLATALRMTDRLLYEAKAGGRNRIRCLTPEDEVAQ